MDTVYETAKKEGAWVALRKLGERDQDFFNKNVKRLKPILEYLHKSDLIYNPRVDIPHSYHDFNWPQCLLDFKVSLELWRIRKIRLFSHIFLRDCDTGQEHALRFLLKHEILKGEVVLTNCISGIKDIRLGETKLILMEDPVFPDEKITIDTFKSLVRTDTPRDIRIGRKWVQKPPNIPVIITGTFNNLLIDGEPQFWESKYFPHVNIHVVDKPVLK